MCSPSMPDPPPPSNRASAVGKSAARRQTFPGGPRPGRNDERILPEHDLRAPEPLEGLEGPEGG